MSSAIERANAIRVLAMDAVQRANSGHPGAPMGMADFAEVLWREVLRHDPANPDWINRDRVVLSNGHASMLLYSALHLTGYDVGIDDLKAFRQLDSKRLGTRNMATALALKPPPSVRTGFRQCRWDGACRTAPGC